MYQHCISFTMTAQKPGLELILCLNKRGSKMDSIEVLIAELSSLPSLLILTHIFPDADAIGSSCALQLGLQALGKKTLLHLPASVPESLLPLTKEGCITDSLPSSHFEAVAAIDTANKERIGLAGEPDFLQGKKLLNIDHHFSNTGYGDLNYVDSKAAASAVIVFDLLCGLKAPITPAMADLLYAGLMDDTGCFRFSNTSPESLECAAALVRCGATPQEVSNHLYFSLPERILHLRAKALAALRVVLDGKIALIALSRRALEECHAQAADTEGLVDLARSVSGTIGAVFMRELDDGVWKLSLRAKNVSLNVHQVAEAFSGGGHQAAAGCKLKGSEEEVEKKILERLAQALIS